MYYREYGKTGKKVSVLGFGGMRFPGGLVSTPQGRERCAQLVVRANELGINFFDTAHEYCGWHSEEIYGLAFKQMKNSFFVSTKSGLHYDRDADAVMRRVEGSLKTMGIEKIHFFHMWRILDLEQYYQVMRPGGPYEGALRAKREGLIDHICFSTHCTGEEIETIVRDDAYDGMIMGYNLINHHYRKKGLEAAKKAGLGVMVMNPLAGGVLPRNAEYFAPLCADGESIVDAALRFVVTEDGITGALSGMTTETELEENVHAIEKIDFEGAKKHSVVIPELQFNDLCTGCGYCSGCPQGLEPKKLMLAYNQKMLEKNNSAALQTALHEWWGYGRTEKFCCIRCGACERKCTQHLPIISRIAEINGIVDRQKERARDNLMRAIGDGGKVALYAAGGIAKAFLDECEECGIQVEGLRVFDGDPKKWGKGFYRGYTVDPPEKIAGLGIRRLIVCIASREGYESIRSSLQAQLNSGTEIVRYVPVSRSEQVL